ncbi:MAG: RteC domain-containing protein [Bacteroidota bacterium]|nr:RteC domain-containing protein [Bacteroidota bacterium]MDP4256111.1 RteC domain-containing protein [Bacteroidota bacterium]MDP4258063.1 RteC domain-containing protein [Bacteroidota bacterium]
MINRKFEALFDDLLLDTRQHMEQNIPCDKKLEWCHRSCLDYWKKLKEQVAMQPFANAREEIDFFRSVKPMFLGKLEYYALLMQFHLFCPVDDPARAAEYMDQEISKIWRFRDHHADFLQYLRRGDVFRDGEYFLRCRQGEQDFVLNRIYDHDHSLSSKMDGLLAQVNAYRWYEDFLRDKMGEGREK